jgi:hypothetical protein
MGNDDNLVRVNVVVAHESPPSGLGHGDCVSPHCSQRFEHVSLGVGRIGRDGVQGDNRGNGEVSEEIEYLAT